MLVKRFSEALAYEAPNHWGVTGLRLQGFENEGPKNQWLGFYKKLISAAKLKDVSSTFAIEQIKYTTKLPLQTGD